VLALVAFAELVALAALVAADEVLPLEPPQALRPTAPTASASAPHRCLVRRATA